MRKLTHHAIRMWLREERLKQSRLYSECPERKPKQYQSHDEAVQSIRKYMKVKRQELTLSGVSEKKPFGIKETAEILIKTVAMVVVPTDGENNRNLAVYDYDRQMYSFNLDVLSDYLVEVTGTSSNTALSSLAMTLVAKRRYMAKYNPLPAYKIAVGNGIYNCVTKKLEPHTPLYTVLTKIHTDYIENAPCPKYPDGFTFDGMVHDFADGNEDRKQLLGQIFKSIITGYHSSASLFLILGQGGDGKSTCFTMITNVIGRSNVAFANFSDIGSPDKLLEALNKKLMLGLDNDVNLYIKQTALLKSMASHEVITLSRKYLSAISFQFTPVIVQLCNEMPRFAETKDSMRRRLVLFKAEHSYYALGTENQSVEKYIKDPKFLEHVLFKILDDYENPYYSDYNDVDRQLVNDTLESEDLIGQFMDEMVAMNVLTPFNKYIPLNHLYSAYLDWLDVTNPSGKQRYAMRGFKSKILDRMHALGYTYDADNSRPRVATLEKNNLYQSSSFGSMLDGKELSKAIQNENGVKCFQLTHDPVVTSHARRRVSKQISVIEYFDLTDEILSTFNAHAHETLSDEDKFEFTFNDGTVKPRTMVSETTAVKIKQVPPTVEDETQVDDDITPVGEHSTSVRAPVDIRVILRDKDKDEIRQYERWLKRVERDSAISELQRSEILLGECELIERYAKSRDDRELLGEVITIDTQDVQDILEILRAVVRSIE